ncbi:nucleotidyltransferase [Prosthecobacter sp.]|uniref:nucleotidyltransferase domain-containing protein n=1 Tax=Prosthecobacter sp. TaxID=1965333 RepID=UPI001D1FB09E|nr:nucleotidyltransferase [Prosthecobacter sp.]MCB1279685.1 nucleotidyltransferase [Prosthecobacter sp.]
MKVELLKAAVESLSIPPGMYEKAVERYEAVTSFLDKPGTRVASWHPSQSVQGSAALGLAIRPLGKEDFDFDVSCEVAPPSHLTSRQVRDEVEKRLREDANYSRMLNTEKLRCLRLDYSEAERFHLDIVVARIARWQSQTGSAVQIPDKALEQWVGSDPRGYIAWFKLRQMVIRRAVNEMAAFSNVKKAEAAPAPEQPKANEKVPLQWVIQLMKRHRDLMFEGNQSHDAPISVIITTLAAKAYQGEEDIIEALKNVTARMVDQFDDAAKTVVMNPVLGSENFADKWPKKPHRRIAFFNWHTRFAQDVQSLLTADKIVGIGKALETLVGANPKSAAFSKQAQFINKLQGAQSLGVIGSAATLAPTYLGAKPMPAHTNFGREVT